MMIFLIIACFIAWTSGATITDGDGIFLSQLNQCPESCSIVGQNSLNWTVYNSASRISKCNETTLLDVSLHLPIDDQSTSTKLFACTANDLAAFSIRASNDDASAECADAKEQSKVAMQYSYTDSQGKKRVASAESIVQVLSTIQNVLRQQQGDCQSRSHFAAADGVVAGIFVGGQINKGDIAQSVLGTLINKAEKGDIISSGTTILEYCKASSDYTVGIVIDTTIASAQNALMKWSNAQCASTSTTTTSEYVLGTRGKIIEQDTEVSIASITRSSTILHEIIRTAANQMASCRYIKVVSGDGCGSLAQKCGISGSDFTKFNSNPNLCSTLAVGQPVCCSPGDLPDLSPKPGPGGQCATYLVVAGDYCNKIISENMIKDIPTLESFNQNTWGWTGCDHLMAGTNICLSTGSAPMPAPISNAVCGPQKPNTQYVPNQPLIWYNPCPLLACCNVWGQCGTTADFCTVTKSATGAPGTGAPGTNGCVTNCGTDIVRHDVKPAEFKKIAYYEAWASQRDCLTMSVYNLADVQFLLLPNMYTHFHFAFAQITSDFHVDVSQVADQFEIFKNGDQILGKAKKIISFGGWAFSTEMSTYAIFRKGVSDANRQTFADNVVQFLKDNNLDGVDFDWEYPGAPDIPGIPAGDPGDGLRYLNFLEMVKKGLAGTGKSLSIAVPASYWYLKGFDPIWAFNGVVDYFVYMTYDLHGQWDYGNKWADEGCPAGACLRSHINSTETMNALSMITKAGADAAKVIVGVTSYGRSFQMTNPSCTGPMCTFTGPNSGATPGRCTQTSGYVSIYEINEILAEDPTAKTTYEPFSASNIMTYGDNWVSYMDDNNKKGRTQFYQALNFGGTSDWAIDLQSEDYIPIIPVPTLGICDKTYTDLDTLMKDVEALNVPYNCVPQYLIGVMSADIKAVIVTYNNLMKDDYDSKYNTYAEYVKDSLLTTISNFMDAHADQYFHCSKPVQMQCCSVQCQNAANCGPPGCSFASDCTQTPGISYVQLPCPHYPGESENIDYTEIRFSLFAQDQFQADILKAGVDPSYYALSDAMVHVNTACGNPLANGCQTFFRGYPFPVQDIHVYNPKDAINSALGNHQSLTDALDATVDEMLWDAFVGDEADVLDSTEIPSYVVGQAIQSMQTVYDTGKKIQQDERKDQIEMFVLGFLMIIPGVGEVAAAADLANLARLIAMLGRTGDLAYGIYGVSQDPQSAWTLLFNFLPGFKDAKPNKDDAFADAAVQRKAISGDLLSKLGDKWNARTGKISTLRGKCLA